jgi:coproporphyrinogen III oxidase-like Fe-S oxidoreductase
VTLSASRHATDHKLKTFARLVTRLSLGVENLSDHLLEINGRAHRSPEIRRAYHTRAAGFRRSTST